MERLTKKYKNGIITLDADKFPGVGQETLDREIGAFAPFRRAVDALYEYEDAEENGTLVRLPCKVGDTVYIISKVTSPKFSKNENGMINGVSSETKLEIRKKPFYYDLLPLMGDLCFTTREEAEAALKARAGNV